MKFLIRALAVVAAFGSFNEAYGRVLPAETLPNEAGLSNVDIQGTYESGHNSLFVRDPRRPRPPKNTGGGGGSSSGGGGQGIRGQGFIPVGGQGGGSSSGSSGTNRPPEGLNPAHGFEENLGWDTYADRGRRGLQSLNDNRPGRQHRDLADFDRYEPLPLPPGSMINDMRHGFPYLKRLNIDYEKPFVPFRVEGVMSDGRYNPEGPILKAYYSKDARTMHLEERFGHKDPYRDKKNPVNDRNGNPIRNLDLSDMVWQTWASVAGEDAGKLETIIMPNIIQLGTEALIDEVFDGLNLQPHRGDYIRSMRADGTYRKGDGPREEHKPVNEQTAAERKRIQLQREVFEGLAGTDNIRPILFMIKDHKEDLGGVTGIEISAWSFKNEESRLNVDGSTKPDAQNHNALVVTLIRP